MSPSPSTQQLSSEVSKGTVEIPYGYQFSILMLKGYMGGPCQEPTPLTDLEVSAFQHLLRVGGVQKLKASRLEIDTIHLFRSVLQDINDADGVKMIRIQRFLVDLHLSMYFSRICLTYRYRPKMKYFRGLKGYCRDSVWVSVLRYDVKEMYRKNPAEN